ncbi:DUF368 domain-containing protein [Paenalkalicoccus suaedae]|uniref:DUF368 domain-containing protein n=1 Tax=Paenalkalicoccus suaedae TaxID=2592382 RepID=A0A859FBI0_9BACI|nr:DUF368 domain-containing protein [Paenalkalicoccus suaedae]QKS70713.1 DUF368 domain-containing protein [Paenalkalicoccus suaedae]
MIGVIVRGIAIGVTETVPGISGSTVAMILGIYKRMLYSLSMLTTKRYKEVLPFLLTFGLGMVIGFGVALFTIDFLLQHFRTPTLLFFVGVILGFLPYLWKEAVEESTLSFAAKHYMIMVIFFSIVIIGQFLGGGNDLQIDSLSTADYVYMFVAGALASCALVLPGISGALTLTILGLYELATRSLIELHLPVVIPIGLGVVCGVLLISKLVRYLLRSYPTETYAAIIGLVAASIFAILANIEGALTPALIVSSVLTCLLGIVTVTLLAKTQ